MDPNIPSHVRNFEVKKEGIIDAVENGEFTRLHVPGDGNCFFESLARLLNLDGIDGMYLRSLIVVELGGATVDVHDDDEDRVNDYRAVFGSTSNLDSYIRRISQRREWVNGLAMCALRNALVRSGILDRLPTFAIYHEKEHWWYYLGDFEGVPLTYCFYYNGYHYDGAQLRFDHQP